jgi:hypothetical protein
MIRAVKTLALITISVSLVHPLNAQIKLPPVSGTGIAPDVKKVVQDYPNRFRNLQGELLIEHPQSVDYACNFKVNGAVQATVTLYSSRQKEVCSWQALMLATEDFEGARKKFKGLFTELNNISIRMDNGSVFQLRGRYEEPVEEKKFTSSLFSFDTEDEAMKKLRVEIVMLYEPMEWKIKVLVYDRDREDNERGEITEQ